MCFSHELQTKLSEPIFPEHTLMSPLCPGSPAYQLHLQRRQIAFPFCATTFIVALKFLTLASGSLDPCHFRFLEIRLLQIPSCQLEIFLKSIFDRLILQTNAFSLGTCQSIITIRHTGNMSDTLLHTHPQTLLEPTLCLLHRPRVENKLLIMIRISEGERLSFYNACDFSSSLNWIWLVQGLESGHN